MPLSLPSPGLGHRERTCHVGMALVSMSPVTGSQDSPAVCSAEHQLPAGSWLLIASTEVPHVCVHWAGSIPVWEPTPDMFEMILAGSVTFFLE